MKAWHELSINEISAVLRTSAVDPLVLAEHMLERIAQLNPRLHAFVTVMTDVALDQARRAREELRRGQSRGPLHGVPIAVKDLCYTRSAPTACGTVALKDWVPDYDATVVQRLEAAGAVLLGKLSMGEGAFTPHPALPAAVNPWSAAHWPGTSSGGSGVACAARLCFAALGTDTGGSIRFPSSACGVSGLKPTWGRVSRHGIFPLAPSLDHVGPMAGSAQDLAAMMNVIAGFDAADPTSSKSPVPDFLAGLDASIAGLRVGVDRRWIEQDVHVDVVQCVQRAIESLRSLGAKIVEIEFPCYEYIITAFETIIAAEAANVHRELVAAQAEQYGPVLRGVVEGGLAIKAVDYAAVMQLRPAFREEVTNLFSTVDVLVAPAMADPTPTLSEFEANLTLPEQMRRSSRFTAPFNMSGHPTLVMPAGRCSRGLPVGLQLIGPELGEERLLRVAHQFQQLHARVDPPID